MRVFLTGAAGMIGRATAALLIERGHEVAAADLTTETDAPHTTYTGCDITDYDAVLGAMAGCDAVVHLAAIRNAMHAPGQDVYRVNLLGTFHVFEAAAKHGIRRVVQASSINALGCAWAIGDYVPDYVPVDEDHPLRPADPYSFSKQQIEDIGVYYWRREGMSSVALRLPGVFPPGQMFAPATLERRHRMREFLDSFAALPDVERARQTALVREAALRHRHERHLEFPSERWALDPIPGIDERLGMAYMFDRFNLWASIDVRDAARAIEQAITADYTGSHAVFVNDTVNSLDYDSETLLRLFYPQVTRRIRPLQGSEALVSTARARDLFGFAPEYSVVTGDPYASGPHPPPPSHSGG